MKNVMLVFNKLKQKIASIKFIQDLIEDSRSIVHLKALSKSNDKHVLFHFKRTKSIFIHIPKAGGISITKALYGGSVSGGHFVAIKLKKVFTEKEFNTYFKFTIVRNPWARTLSAYHFLMKGGLNEMDYTFAENHLKQYVSFEDFILNGLEKKEVQEWVHFIPQYKFIYDKKGKLLVNFIGRLEDIDNDFKVISQKINKNAQLSHLNKNRNSNVDIYTNIYTIEMKDIVKRVYDRDIELFEYKFN